MAATNSSLTQQSEILHAAKALVTYKVAIDIEVYYGIVVWVVGVIGNILSFLVMMMKHNRAISCCVYMAFLAVTDLLCVGMSFFITVYRLLGRVAAHWECKLVAWVMFAASFTSIVMVVAMTVDRFLAICRPLKHLHIRTPRFASKMDAGLVVGILIYTTPYAFLAYRAAGGCTIDGSSVFSRVYAAFNMLVISVVPFIVLTSLNSRIAMVIRRRRKIDVLNLAQPQPAQNMPSSNKREKQLTAVLFVVSGTMLVLTLPLYVYFVLNVFIDPYGSPETFANLQLLFHLATRLSHTNHAINFLLYVMLGKRFRKDLVALFTRGYGRGNRGANTAGTSRRS